MCLPAVGAALTGGTLSGATAGLFAASLGLGLASG